MTDKAKETIERLGLSPLEGEGGFFRFLHEYGEGAGSIYYLVTPSSFSHLHALTDDELWFFLEGDEAEQILVEKNGRIERITLGENNRHNLVKKDVFQSTRIKTPNLGYSLFTTLMSPKYRQEMYISGKDDTRMKEARELEDLL